MSSFKKVHDRFLISWWVCCCRRHVHLSLYSALFFPFYSCVIWKLYRQPALICLISVSYCLFSFEANKYGQSVSHKCYRRRGCSQWRWPLLPSRSRPTLLVVEIWCVTRLLRQLGWHTTRTDILLSRRRASILTLGHVIVTDCQSHATFHTRWPGCECDPSYLEHSTFNSQNTPKTYFSTQCSVSMTFPCGAILNASHFSRSFSFVLLINSRIASKAEQNYDEARRWCCRPTMQNQLLMLTPKWTRLLNLTLLAFCRHSANMKLHAVAYDV